MVDKVVYMSRRFNRSICDSFDAILRTILRQADTPDECVEMIKYVENVTLYEIFKLKVNLII